MVVDDGKLDLIVHKLKNIRTYIHARQSLFNTCTHLEDELIKLEDMVNEMIASADVLSKNIKRVANV